MKLSVPAECISPTDKMKNVTLRSIAFTYPGFQSLPRGIKRMLLVTESFLFDEESTHSGAEGSRGSVRLGPPMEIDPALLSFQSSQGVPPSVSPLPFVPRVNRLY